MNSQNENKIRQLILEALRRKGIDITNIKKQPIATATKPIKVAAYIRVSTNSSEQETSYKEQEMYFTKIINENPQWINAGIYSDHGVSATSKNNRTGFITLLEDCKSGKIDRILCKSVSRFARNTKDFISALNTLRECNVTILFEKEGIDTGLHINDFILTTMGALAQEESRSISANINWSIQKRFSKGIGCNYEIYGYKYSNDEDGSDIRQVEIVPHEAEVVEKIYREVANGMSYKATALMLNNEGITPPCRRGSKPSNKWEKWHIQNIVTNERYCGDALMQKTFTTDYLTHKKVKNKGELPMYYVENHHPAIVNRELFNKVKEVRKLKSRRRQEL